MKDTYASRDNSRSISMRKWLALSIAFLLLTGLGSLQVKFSGQNISKAAPILIQSGDTYLPIIANQPTPEPSPTPPTNHIYGRVTDANGNGLAGVPVTYGLFCSPREHLTTVYSDADGYYDLYGYCPYDHDETMGYYALKSGYKFTPDLVCFRTWGYCTTRVTNFVGEPLR
jgi:hypothetical protein